MNGEKVLLQEYIISPNAPPVLGLYSHTGCAGDFFFVLGQGFIAGDGSGIVHGAVEEETKLTLGNLKRVLADVDLDLEDEVKTVIFLSDRVYSVRFNDVYKAYFPNAKQARACIQTVQLPLDMQVEIGAVAVYGNGTP
jgi:2-iminobutanoate/2-iminopropanoate deaminase